jgi:hypothetical protein
MTIWHMIDDERRLLVVTLTGPVTGGEVRTFGANLYGPRPELFDYECITNLLEYSGDVDYSDLNPLQEIYPGPPASEAAARSGVIVTLDPHFHFWAAALDAQFPGRKHYIAASLEGAFGRLAALRAGQAGHA